MNDQEETPKIIVDEDWKTQVEREKEALRNKEHVDQSPDSKTGDGSTYPPPPPASFESLVSMLASQAMAALGLFADPMTGEAESNRPLAKFLIDTLGVLEEKTSGNRSDDESAHLRDALHHLRMIYVSTPADGMTPMNTTTETPRSPIIELP
jgi:hypothetical protein